MPLADYIPKFSFTWKYMLVLAAIVLLIMAIFYVHRTYLAPKLDPKYVANSEFIDGDREQIAEVVLFTVDWCPYCKKAKPIWDEFEQEYTDKNINGYTVKFRTVNCTDEKNEDVKNILNQYKIEGFPTIKLLKDDQVYNYDAKPTKESLEEFLTTVIKGN